METLNIISKDESVIKVNRSFINVETTKFKFSKENKEAKRLHHIHLLDRSGSMTSYIDKLMDDVKKTLTFMQPDDLVSVVWFSGEGQFNCVLKGASKANDKDIFKILDSLKSTVGRTCFSEAFDTADKIIDELSVICSNFNIMLFTDGDVVVSEYKREISLIESITTKLGSRKEVLSINTIGFGSYYNRDMLVAISERTRFGKCVHSDKIEDYSVIFENDSKELSGKANYLDSLTVNKSEECFYTDCLSYAKFTEGHYKDLPVSGEFSITRLFKSDKKEVSGINEISIPAIYSAIHNSYYIGNTDKALDILKNLGDIEVINRINNSFTSKERQETLDFIKNCIIDDKFRGMSGYDLDFIPSDSIFSVYDLFSVLTEDESNLYFPISSSEYKRISAKVEDKFDLFEADKDAKLSTKFQDNLVFSSEHNNISIRYMIPGTVRILPTAAKSCGLTENVPANVFRMQTLIKDGKLHIDKFMIKASSETIKKIRERCRYHKLDFDKLFSKQDELYLIDLNVLPVISRKYARESNPDDLSLAVLRQFKAKATCKVVKELLKNFPKSFAEKAEGTQYTESQIKVLEEHGIKGGIYSAPKVESSIDKEVNDSYITKSLEFSLKSWSALPSVKDIVDKESKIGTPGDFMHNVYMLYKSATKEELTNALSVEKSVDSAYTFILAQIRLAKSITGSFWEGLESLKDNKYGYKFDNESIPYELIITTKYDTIYL